MKTFVYISKITIVEEVEVPDDVVDIDDITDYVQETACDKINQILVTKDIDFEWSDDYTIKDDMYRVVYESSN